ncbi:MAG: Mut7-C RNAse domain-containing protein [Pyrobaculum sp.]
MGVYVECKGLDSGVPDCIYVDAMLGWLARLLRILFGVRVVYSPSIGDSELAETECLVVTRDEELFKRRRGPAILLKTDSHVEWVAVFIALGMRPFERSRCPVCGGDLAEVDCREAEAAVGHEIRSERCWRCAVCGRYYWVGSHWRRLRRLVEEAGAVSVECRRSG